MDLLRTIEVNFWAESIIQPVFPLLQGSGSQYDGAFRFEVRAIFVSTDGGRVACHLFRATASRSSENQTASRIRQQEAWHDLIALKGATGCVGAAELIDQGSGGSPSSRRGEQDAAEDAPGAVNARR